MKFKSTGAFAAAGPRAFASGEYNAVVYLGWYLWSTVLRRTEPSRLCGLRRACRGAHAGTDARTPLLVGTVSHRCGKL